MPDLVSHLGSIHRWVTGIVADRATTRDEASAYFPTPPTERELDDWYEGGLASLLEVLEGADPDALVWNWRDDRPAPARFWFRRMSLETLVHRWDAEDANGAAGLLDKALCSEGVEEFLSFVSAWLPRRPRPELHGALGLAASDGALNCTLDLAPDHLDWFAGTDGASATVSAATADLYLWMLHRREIGDPLLTVSGDESVVRSWAAITF